MYRVIINLELRGHVDGTAYVALGFEKDIELPFVPVPGIIIIHKQEGVFLESVGWEVENEQFTCTCRQDYVGCDFNMDVEEEKKKYAKHGWKHISTNIIRQGK